MQFEMRIKYIISEVSEIIFKISRIQFSKTSHLTLLE